MPASDVAHACKGGRKKDAEKAEDSGGRRIGLEAILVNRLRHSKIGSGMPNPYGTPDSM